MKATILTCAVLLGIAGLTAPAARAQVCLDWVLFIDGLELYVDGDLITGYWRNADGQGGDEPVVGIIRDGLPLPCRPGPARERDDAQNPAKAGVACLPELGCDVFGWDWYFLLDGLDGTLDEGFDVAGDDGPPGSCGYDELEYDLLLGPCPFRPDTGGPTLMSATRERLRAQGALPDGRP